LKPYLTPICADPEKKFTIPRVRKKILDRFQSFLIFAKRVEHPL